MTNILEKEFKEFIKKYEKRLYIIIYKMVNDKEVAVDILQDTLFDGYRNLKNFEGKSKMYTYFYRIAVNKSISYLRKKKLMNIIPFDSFINFFASKNNNIVDNLINREKIDILNKAVEKLPPKQKAIFLSRAYDNLSFNEIGEIFSITSGAARSNFFQALKKVKKYMEINYEKL